MPTGVSLLQRDLFLIVLNLKEHRDVGVNNMSVVLNYLSSFTYLKMDYLKYAGMQELDTNKKVGAKFSPCSNDTKHNVFIRL